MISTSAIGADYAMQCEDGQSARFIFILLSGRVAVDDDNGGEMTPRMRKARRRAHIFEIDIRRHYYRLRRVVPRAKACIESHGICRVLAFKLKS